MDYSPSRPKSTACRQPCYPCTNSCNPTVFPCQMDLDSPHSWCVLTWFQTEPCPPLSACQASICSLSCDRLLFHFQSSNLLVLDLLTAFQYIVNASFVRWKSCKLQSAMQSTSHRLKRLPEPFAQHPLTPLTKKKLGNFGTAIAR